MTRLKPDAYRHLTCGGCGRRTDQREYWGFPNESTAPTRVHLIADAAAPAYGVRCSCSHYTRYANPDCPRPPKGHLVVLIRRGDVAPALGQRRRNERRFDTPGRP